MGAQSLFHGKYRRWISYATHRETASTEKRKNLSHRLLGLMTRGGWLGLLAIAIGWPALMAQTCHRDAAVWIYQCPYDVVRNLDERQRLFDLANPNRWRIGEFFLNVSIACTPSPNCEPLGICCRVEGANYRAALHDFLGEAHQRGFRVQALFGDKKLALRDNHNRARAIIRAIVDFNNEGPPDQSFDGVHSDVEPHTLVREPDDQYARDPIGTLRQYLDMNALILEELAGRNLSYGVDIPDKWYPFRDHSGNLDARCELQMTYRGRKDYPAMHLLDLVKSVSIMSYYADAEKIVRKTKYMMDYAVDVGAKVNVGIQTARDIPDGRCPNERSRRCADTFWCSGPAEMEAALCYIDNALSRYSSFQGFAYFKYSTLRDLVE